MIRPTNINISAHTADFKCDQHDAYETALDLNVTAEYTEAGEVRIKGSMLTQGTETCNHVSTFPLTVAAPSSQLIADINAAKTA